MVASIARLAQDAAVAIPGNGRLHSINDWQGRIRIESVDCVVDDVLVPGQVAHVLDDPDE